MAEQWPVSSLHEKSAQQCATDYVVPLRSHRIHIKGILHPRYSRKAVEINSSKRGNRSKVNRKADRERNKDKFGVSKLVGGIRIWIALGYQRCFGPGELLLYPK